MTQNTAEIIHEALETSKDSIVENKSSSKISKRAPLPRYVPGITGSK